MQAAQLADFSSQEPCNAEVPDKQHADCCAPRNLLVRNH